MRRLLGTAHAGARLGLLGLCFLGLAACGSNEAASLSSSEDAAAESEPAILVELGDFRRGEISQQLQVAADLEALAKADVPSEVAGIVEEVVQSEGDRVARGDVVLRLRSDERKLAVETRRIQARQAATRVKLADVARRAGDQAVEQKRVLLLQAKEAYERMQRLAAEGSTGVISREEADDKRFAHEQAVIEHTTAVLERQKQEIAHEEALQNAELATVELKTAEFNLSQTILRAPIGGVISYLRAKPGELVSLNTNVFTVVELEHLQARLHVPQRELAHLRPGLDVVIRCEVFPEKAFSGQVDVVNPVVAENGSVELLVRVSDPKRFLKPGLFVTGEIILDTRHDAVLVPKRAVSYANKEPVIFLVNDSVARRYVVEPGYSNKDSIEVRGLRDANGVMTSTDNGALVVVGHNNLKEGSRVETPPRR